MRTSRQPCRGRLVKCAACGRYHEFKRVSVTFTTPCLKCKTTLTIEGPLRNDECEAIEREIADLTNAIRK